MVKILSKSGDSLADVYDVEGSIAGIETLESKELPLVHEMGATVFSERFSGAIRRVTSGAIAQSLAWNVVLTDLPATPTRIFGCVVFADNAARVLNAMVGIRDGVDAREIPIFAWDDNLGNVVARMDDAGAGIASRALLQNGLAIGTLPSMLVGSEQPQEVDQIAFRGAATAFGAGTVVITALIYIGFSQIGGISSRGLPFPGW